MYDAFAALERLGDSSAGRRGWSGFGAGHQAPKGCLGEGCLPVVNGE